MHIHLHDPLGPINIIFFKIILYCLTTFSIIVNYPQLGAVFPTTKRRKRNHKNLAQKDAEYQHLLLFLPAGQIHTQQIILKQQLNISKAKLFHLLS